MTDRAAVEPAPSTVVHGGADSWFKDRLAFIAIVGALWRIGYLVVIKADDVLELNHSLYYSIQASLNSEGLWFQDGLTGQPGAEHGFLTSMYLTPWSLGPGGFVLRQRFALTLVGIATVVVVGLTGRRLGNAVTGRMQSRNDARAAGRIGLAAAGIAAVYPNLWIHDSVVMSESISIFLVSCALFLAVKHHEHPTVRSAIPLGVVAGLGALNRSDLVILLVGFAWLTLALCRRRGQPRTPALALAVAGIVTMLPWSLYNVDRFHEPTWLSTSDGSELLGANCDATYYEDVGGWSLNCLGGTLEPLGDGSVVSDSSDRAALQRDRALTYMDENFSRIPVVVAARVGRLLDVYGLPALVSLDEADEKEEWAVWAGIACWWILAVFAIAGWRILSRRGIGVRWWFAVPWIGVLVTTVTFYGSHRNRAPSEPAIVLLASIAVVAVLGRASTYRRTERNGDETEATADLAASSDALAGTTVLSS